jgi:hypothetical protein
MPFLDEGDVMKKTILYLIAGALAVLPGCQDLGVTNLNEPDESRALASSSDVEALVAGSIGTWFSIHDQWGIEHLGVVADALTCSWGNYSMRDMSSEPRIAYPNATSYTYRGAIEQPWYRSYRALSAANDGLRAIAGGLQIGDKGKDTPRAKAFAKLVQGLAHGYLASFFDRAYIYDETVDVNIDVLELKPYQEVGAAAIKQLEEAIALLEANSFETPESWVNGVIMTNLELAEVAHSYAARYLAQIARNPAERGAVDWNKVKFHAEKGVKKAFAPHGDGLEGDGPWFHSQHYFHNDRGDSWARLDYKMIGPSDKSGKYQEWLNKPVAQRTEFDMVTDDKRLTGMTLKNSSGVDVDGGIYAGNWGASPFPRARGTYHFSKYGYYRYENYIAGGSKDPMPVFLPAENDFLIAEALLWTGGSLDEAAALINKTRVTNGGYPPATAADTKGSVDQDRDPKPGATLWQMLKYEKHLECLMTGVGLEYFDNRGWGDLVNNTPIQAPIPAKELNVLQQEVYTFGGGGPGSAPKVGHRRPARPE